MFLFLFVVLLQIENRIRRDSCLYEIYGKRATNMLKCLLTLCLPLSVSSHGSLLFPLPRGGIDRSLPIYVNGSFPSGHYNCECTNSSEPFCESAQSCLWFENGCTIGCPCSGNGTLSREAGYSACEHPTTNATNNNPQTRTLNRLAEVRDRTAITPSLRLLSLSPVVFVSQRTLLSSQRRNVIVQSCLIRLVQKMMFTETCRGTFIR